MKFYNYSVKEALASYFGENTLLEMRRKNDKIYTPEDEEHITQLLWQEADQRVLNRFLGVNFLLDTILEDDYIAYLYQCDSEKKVYLMFMDTEDEPIFNMNVEYAKELVEEWKAKGYEPSILRECIDINHYGSNMGFYFVKNNFKGLTEEFYRLKYINDKPILVFSYPRYMEYYDRKMVFISGTEDLREYECLFTDDVEITRGDEKNEKIISKGIGAVRDLLRGKPVRIAYQEFKNTGTYFQTLITGENELGIYVNVSNLICKIHLQEISGNLIIDESDNSYGSLIGHIPQLIGMRILSPEQIHGYALQFKYADDSTRNYYLHCFDTREIPEVCNISGYKFTNDDFMSAALDDAGNVTFRNGYRVPRHVLFYRSTRQVDIEHTDIDLYKGDEIIIHSLYRLPVEEESRRWKKIPWYRGRPDENYGTAEAFLDDNGVRVSDISVYSKEKKEGIMGAYLVCVEPTGKYGYLNGDGTWFAPPIYDRAEIFTDKCAMVARAGKNFLLTSDSTEKQFDFPIDLVQFTNNRYLFKAEEWKGEEPDAGHYYDYNDVSPGKWGVMDSDCRVIVEPKYVFAVACWDMELNLKEYSIVARFVDEKLRWGVIDVDGIEVIPCIFSELYSCWGNSIVFQTKEQGPYGLMDFNGNIIVEPMFGYIDDYNVEHRLITAGDYEDDLGVYSIDLGKMIISGDFDCIDYGEHMISCEPFGSSSWKRYFDYSGKEIFFEGYDCVFELSGGLLCAYKDRKSGLIDLEGNVILPPISGGMSVLTNYNKGYVVTGIDNRKGLSRVSGEVILPEIYSDIRFYGDILVASERIEGNRCIRDTLFTLDERPLLKGPYRHINIDEKSNTLSFESPLGHEYCKIIRNDV